MSFCRRYSRRHITVKGLRDIFSADLVDMTSHAKENRDYKYLLTVICNFSKYAFIRPLKNKTAAEVTAAMQSIFESPEKQFLKPPKLLHVDRGGEFYSAAFHKMLNRFKVKMFSVHSNLKGATIERFNRSFKNLMYREFSARGTYNWVDMLDELIKQYNASYHRTIKMSPGKVTPRDESKLKAIHNSNHTAVQRGKVKFRVGGTVRISGIKSVFTKGFYPNWSTELFKVTEVCNTCPVTQT